jgi:hypothetical protein
MDSASASAMDSASTSTLSYSDYTQTNDFKFQELVRILAATLHRVNPSGQKNGFNGIWIANALIREFPGICGWISRDLEAKFSDLGLYGANRLENPRKALEDFYMHPFPEYQPWEIVSVLPSSISRILCEIESKNRFAISLDNGMIVVSCVRDPKFTSLLYKGFERITAMRPEAANVTKSADKSHITLVPHGIMVSLEKQYGSKAITDFVESYQDRTENFPVKITELVTNFSRNWERFSLFYAFHIESPQISNFLDEMEKRFPLESDLDFYAKKKENLHITIATQRRDLFFEG